MGASIPGNTAARWTDDAWPRIAAVGADGYERVAVVDGQGLGPDKDVEVEIVGDSLVVHDRTFGGAFEYTPTNFDTWSYLGNYHG